MFTIIDRTKISFPLMGEVTIAEMVERLESESAVKVVRADLENGIVTLTAEPLPDVNNEPEFEECFECGACGNVHESWCPYNEP